MDDIKSNEPTPTTPANQDTGAAPQPTQQATNPVVPTPSTPTPSVVSAPSTSAVPPTPAQGVPQDTNQSPSGPETAAPMVTNAVPKKHTGMLVAVTVMILVVLGLGTAAYFTFMKEDTKTTTPATETSVAEDTVERNPTSTLEEIDANTTKLDDAKDYGAATLNDTTLGL